MSRDEVMMNRHFARLCLFLGTAMSGCGGPPTVTIAPIRSGLVGPAARPAASVELYENGVAPNRRWRAIGTVYTRCAMAFTNNAVMEAAAVREAAGIYGADAVIVPRGPCSQGVALSWVDRSDGR
jgi:hypothetical protein